ncbi:porin [Sediminimonas qiaohouensis]|uniref:porin n=1 Tax=Sediminimonas qiaohouensis TaxID=552061 RepID=UPI0004795D22|nr:porin [Sediminimonas qiaohouensis]
MKKILFATTALVATAGVAAADVSFGGYARWGVDHVEGRVGDETRIESRFRLVVTATTESDGGLTFGSQIRYQANEGTSGYSATSVTAMGSGAVVGGHGGFNSPRFWVSTGGLEISMGHVQGALEFMPGMYAGSVGLTGLGYANVVYNYAGDLYTSGGNGRQGVDIKYSAGDFSAHLSHSMKQNGYGFNGTTERTAGWVAYSFGDYSAALALQDSNQSGDNEWALTASGTFGPANVTLQVADNGNMIANSNTMKYGLAASFDVGAATSVSAYINHDEALNGFTGDENMGVGVVHDLGGGASVRGGIADTAGTTRADLGVQFSF